MIPRLNRAGFQRLIDEDAAWLKSMPDTLERQHILDILAVIVDMEYGIDQEAAHARLHERLMAMTVTEKIDHLTKIGILDADGDLSSDYGRQGLSTRAPLSATITPEEN